MRQSLKYSIVVVLVMLLHSVTMKAVDFSHTTTHLSQEECFISQARSATAKNAFKRFHIYCATVPCEMAHTDLSHIPTDKSFLRAETICRKYKMRNTFLSDIALNLHIHSLSDPLTYYVYGLRKIIL